MNKAPERLWILRTDKGAKRTYAATKDAARAKAESKGLRVKSVRLGKSRDFLENIRNINRKAPTMNQPEEQNQTVSAPETRKHPLDDISEKIYWREVSPESKIVGKRHSFFCDGKLVYWHGHESSEAQNWLSDEAQIQRRKLAQMNKAPEQNQKVSAPETRDFDRYPKGYWPSDWQEKFEEMEQEIARINQIHDNAISEHSETIQKWFSYQDTKERETFALTAELERVKQQRDALLAALKQISWHCACDGEEAARIARAAIAAVEGGKQ